MLNFIKIVVGNHKFTHYGKEDKKNFSLEVYFLQ